jgi:hypothetical protein
MRRHPGRTLGVLVVAAAAVLGAIYLVGAVAPDAQPAVILVGAIAYLITIPLWYVVQRRRHW